MFSVLSVAQNGKKEENLYEACPENPSRLQCRYRHLRGGGGLLSALLDGSSDRGKLNLRHGPVCRDLFEHFSDHDAEFEIRLYRCGGAND